MKSRPRRGTAQPRQPVDYVDPNIGSIGHLLRTTAPLVQAPFGMVRLAPLTSPGTMDRYLAERIHGFPLGPAALMVATGEGHGFTSLYDHDFETATPYYYSVLLEDFGITAELTATATAAYYRFRFPASANAQVRVAVQDGKGEIQGLGSRRFAGHGRTRHGAKAYFYAEVSKALGHGETLTGQDAGLLFHTATARNETIELRVGVSYIGIEQARRNLRREIPAWGLATVKARTRALWNRELGKIAITGGTEKQRTIFYTALYRSLSRPTNVTEEGRYYSPFDRRVHEAGGHDFYTQDGLWDTYRCLHPLQLLLDAPRQLDMVRSYLRMYDQGGWLPSFPLVCGDHPVMLGHHAAALIADTYFKGYRDFDVAKAYAAMRKNATEASMIPWHRGPVTAIDQVYFAKGFFPALARGEAETVPEVHVHERRQAVTVTLETCYDDWCLAQMAKDLGKSDDYELFMRRAGNYANVYNPRTGWMAPRSADGKWVEGYDPKLGGGQGGRDWFAECNGWIFTFHVQHDPAGLSALMGGDDQFASRLDALFTEQYEPTNKYTFLAKFPDMTGLIGMYAQGNEPSFHIPFLYNYCGQPWKTQRRLRQILDVWYGDGPLGICGDEDDGAMSSWYVFAALGFYPVCPGKPTYDLASPLFEEATLTLGNGKRLTIRARHTSAQNKYIQSAKLNHKTLAGPRFHHADIAHGGTLEFIMGPRPNKAWGVSPD